MDRWDVRLRLGLGWVVRRRFDNVGGGSTFAIRSVVGDAKGSYVAARDAGEANRPEGP